MQVARMVVAATVFVAGLSGSSLQAFDIVNRWTHTQTDGGGIDRGDAITLRWSVVPDGESYDRSGSSDLVGFMDDQWSIPAQDRSPDLTNRPWFALFQRAYDQYEYVSGLTLTYTPEQNSNGTSTNQFGDMRIGGEPFDPGGSVLADNTFPNHGDMRIDTSETPFYHPGNPQGVINLISHESGHGVGLGHSELQGASAVMQSFLQSHFFGLQFDDVYAFNRLYGDPREKLGGNDTIGTSVYLGAVNSNTKFSLGTDATDSVVAEFEDDWLGIDGSSDEDWFRFQTRDTAVAKISVTPIGPTYTMGGEHWDASRQSDLRFEVYRPDGTLLRSVDATGLGQAETLQPVTLFDRGNYSVRVVGDEDLNQFYQLDVEVDLPELQLTVDRETGEVSMSGLYSTAGQFDAYRIQSPSGSLNPSNGAWLSFEDQNRSSWTEEIATTTSLQESLTSGVDQLADTDSVSLGNSYAQVASTPFGTPDHGDLVFSYQDPAQPGVWVNGAVEYIGEVLHNNLVLKVDPSTGEASLTNVSSTAVQIDSYSITSGSSSLDPDGWSSLEDQMVFDWRESNPDSGRLTELKPTTALEILPGEVYGLGELFDSNGQQDLSFDYLFLGETDFREGVVLYQEVDIPTEFDMVLTVDPVTGLAVLSNEGDDPINFDSYTIASVSGALDVLEWESLDDQEVEDWRESNPTEYSLNELKPFGVTELLPGESFELGELFDVLGAQDLELTFLLDQASESRIGSVVYESLFDPGDYDRDGDVDIDDYLRWRSTYGSTEDFAADGNNDGVVDAADYAVWRNNYTASLTVTAGGASPQHGAVPEALSINLLVLALAVLANAPARRANRA